MLLIREGCSPECAMHKRPIVSCCHPAAAQMPSICLHIVFHSSCCLQALQVILYLEQKDSLIQLDTAATDGAISHSLKKFAPIAGPCLHHQFCRVFSTRQHDHVQALLYVAACLGDFFTACLAMTVLYPLLRVHCTVGVGPDTRTPDRTTY